MADWFPGKRVEQIAMAKSWIGVLVNKGSEWGISAEEIRELSERAMEAEKLFAQVMAANRNPIIVTQCTEAFSSLAALMRNMKKRHFFIPPLIDSDLVSLGLRPRVTARSHIPAPAGQAVVGISYPGPHLLLLHIKLMASDLLDPRARYGFNIQYGVLPPGRASVEEATGPRRSLLKVPVNGTELPHSQSSRRRRVLMEFPAEDSGKTAYFSVRLENAKGDKGPWGPVFSAIIP